MKIKLLRILLLACGTSALSGCGVAIGAIYPDLADSTTANLLFSGVTVGAKMRKDEYENDKAYDSNQDARIRLYHKNSAGSRAYADTTCKPARKARKIEVGTGLMDQARSMGNNNKNVSLGMPETEYSRKTLAAKQLLGHRFYREWAVTGGQPVTVEVTDLRAGNRLETPMSVIESKSLSCVKRVFFTPEAGADYEVEINTIEEGGCAIRVTQISQTAAGSVSATEIPISNCTTR